MGPIIGATVLAALAYAGSCAIWPFGRCRRRRCSGGRIYRTGGKVFRDCRRCGGSGRRLRLGRRMWNAYRRRRAATR